MMVAGKGVRRFDSVEWDCGRPNSLTPKKILYQNSVEFKVRTSRYINMN